MFVLPLRRLVWYWPMQTPSWGTLDGRVDFTVPSEVNYGGVEKGSAHRVAVLHTLESFPVQYLVNQQYHDLRAAGMDLLEEFFKEPPGRELPGDLLDPGSNRTKALDLLRRNERLWPEERRDCQARSKEMDAWTPCRQLGAYGRVWVCLLCCHFVGKNLATMSSADRSWLFLLWALRVDASSLVGPGAVGSYQGGGGGRRFGGFAQVTEPPVGFFVGGSSIRELNGLYSRDAKPPFGFGHSFVFSYRHDFTGWRMALVAAPEDVKRSTGRGTEWVMIDPDKADRLRHDGDTYIPGAGTRWSHVHRTKEAKSNPQAGTSVAAAEEDDEEELPWQVVGINGLDMLQKLKRYFAFYKHEVQNAIEGRNLPPLPMGGMGLQTSPPEGKDLPQAALAMEDGPDGCAEGAASVSEAEAELQKTRAAKDHWASAALLVRVGACLRWSREFEAAEKAVRGALDLFPRYAAALDELGRLQLDMGLYAQSLRTFETLLRVDRTWSTVSDWLVRTATLIRRADATAPSEKPAVRSGRTKLCVAWRQTGACSPAGPLEPGSDKPCTEMIARGASGFCQCEGLGAPGAHGSAAESGCDHEPFTCAQKCIERRQAESGEGPRLSPEAATLATEVGKRPHAEPCSLLRGEGALPDWCHPNHYQVLGVRCDFPGPPAGQEENYESDELKRAYKRRSLQYHPDKRGGSAVAFQRVADAYKVLLDPEQRRIFDEGADFPRTKKYFPERFDFEPFGDPHSDRRESAARKQRLLERRRQEALAREAHNHNMQGKSEL
eukprot:s522_g6.t5